jgi:F-type H+-transporting ATPase subunit c
VLKRGRVRETQKHRQKKQPQTERKHMMLADLSGNLPLGLVGLGATLGVGIAAAKASEAIGRNPGAFGKVFTTALIGMALAEGLAILAFFVVSR